MESWEKEKKMKAKFGKTPNAKKARGSCRGFLSVVISCVSYHGCCILRHPLPYRPPLNKFCYGDAVGVVSLQDSLRIFFLYNGCKTVDQKTVFFNTFCRLIAVCADFQGGAV